MPDIIKFYRPNELYGEFSNFYMRDIDVDGLKWGSTEHFFQAMKSLVPEIREYVRTQLPRPGQVKRYCTEQIELRADWETSLQGVTPAMLELYSDGEGLVVDRVKDHFMYTSLIAKFTQHRDLADLLLQTGNAHIIEDTQKVGSDPYWGNGPSGNGLNKLGRMLMLVRRELPRHLMAQSI